jgi:predicted transcriptional regulator
MARKRDAHDLGRRERQILDVIYRLGEASVAEVLEHIPDPPAYDSVRTMIRVLESKGFLRHRRQGTKYIYRPTQSHESASRSAVAHMMKTFFRDSASETMAAIFDVSGDNLDDEEFERLEKLIEKAKKEGR